MLKITALCSLTWMFLLPVQLACGAQSGDEVTRTVRAEMAKQQIPGLALLVSRKGVPIRAEGFGLSNVELNVTVKSETIFQSGSMGKQFTAAAVMLLVEAGKIGLNDPLSMYFAEAPSWWKDVTIRELLSDSLEDRGSQGVP